MVLISIIIPVYNNKKYLSACLGSILEQEFGDYEIILIDDGSTDGSGEVCDTYIENNKVKVLHTENRGVANARNLGIQESQGEYVWFVDSDDKISSKSLRILEQAISEHNPDFISFGMVEYYLQDEKVLKKTVKTPRNHFFKDTQEAFSYLQQHELLDLVADKVCRRSIIVENNIFFSQKYVPTEDHVFWLMVYPKLKNIQVLNCNLYYYYLRNDNSSTRQLRYYKFQAYAVALKKMIQLAELYEVFNEMQDYLYKIYCYYLLWEFEVLNHKECKFGFRERWHYYKRTFQTNDFDINFKTSASKYYFENGNIVKSRYEKIILKSLVNNRCLFAAFVSYLIHIYTKLRR